MSKEVGKHQEVVSVCPLATLCHKVSGMRGASSLIHMRLFPCCLIFSMADEGISDPPCQFYRNSLVLMLWPSLDPGKKEFTIPTFSSLVRGWKARTWIVFFCWMKFYVSCCYVVPPVLGSLKFPFLLLDFLLLLQLLLLFKKVCSCT